MPTYEYECLKCSHTFEEFKEITAAPRARCPRCRGKVQRLISGGAGFVFKGSGWYATDARSKGPRSASKQEEGPARTPTADAAPSPAAEPSKSPPTETAPPRAGQEPGRES
jgi:putative FmdB family regulatory protein